MLLLKIIFFVVLIFKIRSFGGPVHQTFITYSIDNVTVATVDQSGLITASVPGDAIVTG